MDSRPASPPDNTRDSKMQWGTRLGIILAVAGSAVGLGNFLRFPGNAAANGGGAFMIPYFISFLLLGIPIGWAEWAMGRYGGRKGFHSTPAIMGVWGKGPVARYMGAFGVLVPLVIYFYYVVIESWCLRYAIAYATGGIGVDPGAAVAAQVEASKAYFGEVAFSGSNGVLDENGVHPSLWFWVVTFALNVWFVFRGLSKGIEKFCLWAMPQQVRPSTLPPSRAPRASLIARSPPTTARSTEFRRRLQFSAPSKSSPFSTPPIRSCGSSMPAGSIRRPRTAPFSTGCASSAGCLTW
jgi:hypothetical protein